VERLAAVNADIRAFVEMLEPVVLDYCVGLAGVPHHVHRTSEAHGVARGRMVVGGGHAT
jgi:hypothetical protein